MMLSKKGLEEAVCLAKFWIDQYRDFQPKTNALKHVFCLSQAVVQLNEIIENNKIKADTAQNVETSVVQHTRSTPNTDDFDDLFEYIRRQEKALDLVRDERNRQDNKWGDQNHEPILWMSLLGEEFGELCQAVNESTFNDSDKKHLGGKENMLKEAVQVAAVAAEFVECLDRRYPGLLDKTLGNSCHEAE